jgi:hypothetical protein
VTRAGLPSGAALTCVLAGLGACGGGHPPAPSPAPTPAVTDAAPDTPTAPGDSIVSTPTYPNVHVRLRLSQQAPALPQRTDEVELWLDGTRFHVRDLSGRSPSMILGELSAPRGLGVPARTMEEIMDRKSAARRTPAGPTDLYGDLASGDGWVYPPRGERWAMPASELAPAAEQILAAGRDAGLTRTGATTHLGKDAATYHGVVDADEDGTTFHGDVTRLLAPPYLLSERVHDAGNAAHYFAREVLALDEGSVTDADLTPP